MNVKQCSRKKIRGASRSRPRPCRVVGTRCSTCRGSAAACGGVAGAWAGSARARGQW